jgi:hypothetical protein
MIVPQTNCPSSFSTVSVPFGEDPVLAWAGQGLAELAVVVAVRPFGQAADEQFANVTLVMLPTAVLPATVPSTLEVVHVTVETLLPSAFVAVRVALEADFRLAFMLPLNTLPCVPAQSSPVPSPEHTLALTDGAAKAITSAIARPMMLFLIFIFSLLGYVR